MFFVTLKTKIIQKIILMYSFIEQRITYSLREVFSLLIFGITFALSIIRTFNYTKRYAH